MRVVHRGGAVRRPTGMGDAGEPHQAARRMVDLRGQLGHALRAASALQTGGLLQLRLRAMHCHAARVIATVLQALQTLDQDGHHVF